VTLTVVAAPAALSLAPTSLSFNGLVGQPLTSQTITVTNASYGSFNWSVATDAAWLTASPSSGATPGSLAVAVNSSGLATGSYHGNVTVTGAGVANSPQTIGVNLQLLAPVLRESFADQGSGWIISPMGQANGWSVANGVYSYSGAGLSQSCAGNSSWTDYTFDSNIQLSSVSNWPGGVRARVNPATGAGYAVWLYPGSGMAVLYTVPQWDINGPGVTEIARARLSFDTAVHDLRVDFRGSTISAFWDGAQIISATDATYAEGFVCFDADSQPISYSKVTIGAVQNQVTIDRTVSGIAFNATPGVSPAAQTIDVTAGGASTTWAATANVPWLRLSASNSLTPGALTVTPNSSMLAIGTYAGSITLSAPGASNSPLTIPVTLAVKSAALSIGPSNLVFFGAANLNPSAQAVQVANVGTGTLNWTASATNNWLAFSPASGTAPATITVAPSATTTGLGSFTDTITINSPDASNGPVTVPVSLQVGSLLFRDGFSSGADNWTSSPLGNSAGWSVVNGAYNYNAGGHTQVYAGDSTWSNYTVAADIQLSSMNDYPGGLRGRVNSSTGASYGVWIYPAEGVLKLFRIGQWNIDADLTLLGQSAQVAMDTKPHNLRLVFQGISIGVYYDNHLAISASDGSYSQGAVALDVSNQPISFDNVTVISLP
jgi:hypothetical protein